MELSTDWLGQEKTLCKTEWRREEDGMTEWDKWRWTEKGGHRGRGKAGVSAVGLERTRKEAEWNWVWLSSSVSQCSNRRRGGARQREDAASRLMFWIMAGLDLDPPHWNHHFSRIALHSMEDLYIQQCRKTILQHHHINTLFTDEGRTGAPGSLNPFCSSQHTEALVWGFGRLWWSSAMVYFARKYCIITSLSWF